MNDDNNGPEVPTSEMMQFAADLAADLGKAINAFADARKINRKEIPFQETLIALGSLVANGVIQQPEAERAAWLLYLINGVTTGTGVHFFVAPLTPDAVAKLEGSPGKGNLNS